MEYTLGEVLDCDQIIEWIQLVNSTAPRATEITLALRQIKEFNRDLGVSLFAGIILTWGQLHLLHVYLPSACQRRAPGGGTMPAPQHGAMSVPQRYVRLDLLAYLNRIGQLQPSTCGML